jgi:hypothetical protein
VFEVYHGQAFCLQAMQDGASRWQLRKQLLKKAVVWLSNVQFFLGPYCVTKCLTAPILLFQQQHPLATQADGPRALMWQ